MSAVEKEDRPRRSRREERKEETRAELIEAAAKVFARRGFHGASVEQIAAEAGFSTGAVYWHFEDKEDLFLALYEHWVGKRVGEIEAAWSEEGPLVERARAAADDWMQQLERSPEPFLLRLEFVTQAARDPKLRDKLSTRVGAVPLAVRRLLEDSIAAEGLELSVPSDDVALALQALSLGLALEALSNPDAVRPGLNGDLAALFIEALEARASRAR
jgi:AcrR family transcriptional regulator